MSTLMRVQDCVPNSHALAHDIAELSVEICLGGDANPQGLLRRAADSLAEQAGKGKASLVILAQPATGAMPWEPVMFACSDDSVDLESLSMISICNEADVPVNAIPDPSTHCYKRDEVMPDFAWINSQSLKRREAAGIFDFARASTSIGTNGEENRLVVELTGRDRAWRPSTRDLDLTCATSDIMSVAYTERILRPGHARQNLLGHLTPAQRQVSMLLTEGITEPEIAQIIRRSPHTVHDHIKAVFRAWDVHSRAEAISLWRHPFETISHT